MATTVATSNIASRTAPRGRLAQLGRWELVQLSAEGALSHVHRARPAESAGNGPCRYALKRLKPEWEADEAAIGLLRREAVVGTTVQHRSLVPVLDAQVERAPYWVVMPWLEGITLAELLRCGPLDHPVAYWYARQVAEALEALHAAGWMHGDVKPSNMIVSPEGHLTLVDLGFARRRGDHRWTLDEGGLGTPQYLAPEAVTSAVRPDIRSDLYSLGVMLYEMLVGRRPFEAADAAELVRLHRENRPRPLQSLVPQVPRAAAELVMSMLAKEPLRRPQTPREVIDALVSLEVETFAARWSPASA
ncbi:MAG TPA: serine/threonine-protein kinase [Pirellulales bacterium]|nr:serine/threonine-protein kinase [Pirellulales bacterium]